MSDEKKISANPARKAGTKTRAPRRGWGGIRQLPSGRFQARYVHIHEGMEKRYNAPETFASKLDAEGWLSSERRLIDLDAWTPPEERAKKSVAEGTTVIEYLDLYHARKQKSGEIRASTAQTYRNTVDNRIRPYPIADVLITRLTRDMVYAWWDEMAVEHNGTPETNRKAHVRLKAAMGDAVDRGYIETNPVAVRAASAKPSSKKKELPTTEELRAIVDNIPDQYRLLGVVCAFHGLRVGEALGLRGKDVSLAGETATIHIRGNLQRIADKDGRMGMVRQEAKTDAGKRDVPVFPEYAPLLRDVAGKVRPDELLSTTRTGNPVMDTSFRSVWNRARDKAGVRNDITPHYGRNWLITQLAEQGATPAEIGQIVGQSDIQTTVGVYMKVRQQRPVDLMRRVADDSSNE